MTYTVEDIITKVITSGVKLSVSDKTILYSISRQISKNIGLTDRQHKLVKEKILPYKEELESHGVVDLESVLANLRLPLRVVDRSKSISITDSNGVRKSDTHKWIRVRFPFSKKTIVLIEVLSQKHKGNYFHEKGSSSHYFRLNEVTVRSIVDTFEDKNFDIDQELLDLNQRIKECEMKKEEYVPGLYDDQLLNFRPAGLQLIESELGGYNNDKLLKLYDRRRRYGIAHIECERPAGLLGNVAFRDRANIVVDPDNHNFTEIAEVVMQLDRFPILVTIDENHALEQVKTVYNAFSAHVSNETQSVLFRVDNTAEYNVNNFIKDKQLNNRVDKNTKIVYINKNKLPKVLLRAEWQPVCVLALSGVRANTYVATYVSDISDLTICVSKECDLFGRKKYNGFM